MSGQGQRRRTTASEQGFFASVMAGRGAGGSVNETTTRLALERRGAGSNVVARVVNGYGTALGIESNISVAATATFVVPSSSAWFSVACRVGVVMAEVDGERAEVFAILTSGGSTNDSDVIFQRPAATGSGYSHGHMWVESPAGATVTLSLLGDTATCESFVAEARFLATPISAPS